MPYTSPTLTTAIADLASRLNDADLIHWTSAELTTYLYEALRTWNVWTSTWRDQGTLTTTVNQAFYDLTTDLSGALRAQTLTNWDLIADLQYALLEPAAAGGTWTGTDQFTLAQLSSAIQRRRDQFLRESGVQLTRTTTNYAVPPASGRVVLAESVQHVRRAAWRPTATQFSRSLIRTDEWAATNFAPAWRQSTQPPSAYSVSAVPPLTLQLIPAAAAAGDLDLISINAGAVIDPVVESALGIPDDYAWIVKYGALADLLSGDGLALDPQRALYCESRWQQGVDQARANPVVLAAQINAVTCRIGSLADADKFSPTWQLVAGTPRSVLLTGQNLLAVWPPPGATGGPWTVTLDVVRNAPVPTLAADVLQIAPEIYDTILDLAQHTALFKQGPGEVDLAMALLERAARAAGITLNFQQAEQPDRTALNGQQQQDRRSQAEQRAALAIPVEG